MSEVHQRGIRKSKQRREKGRSKVSAKKKGNIVVMSAGKAVAEFKERETHDRFTGVVPKLTNHNCNP